jgi:hypothetical protein
MPESTKQDLSDDVEIDMFGGQSILLKTVNN